MASGIINSLQEIVTEGIAYFHEEKRCRYAQCHLAQLSVSHFILWVNLFCHLTPFMIVTNPVSLSEIQYVSHKLAALLETILEVLVSLSQWEILE